MEIFREIDLMKNTKKTVLKNLTVKTGEKRRSQRYMFRGWQQMATYFDFKICSRCTTSSRSQLLCTAAWQKAVTQS